MPRLHDHVLAPDAYTVRLMLALAGVAHETVAVDAYPGGGDVPVFEDGDVVLRDAGLIVTYVARSYAPGFLPAAEAGAISKWLAFAALDLAALNAARSVAVLGAAGDLAALMAQGRAALRQLEDHLTLRGLDGHDWLAGSAPTIADIAVFPPVALSHDCGIGHEDYPAINLWQRRVRRLPRFIGMPGIPDYF